MGRILPSIVLVSIAFIVAELLLGSASITQPILWPFLLLIYGPGALLIRESVRRSKRGCESVVLLGAAYGFVEEGLALESLYNPTLYGAADWGARIAELVCKPDSRQGRAHYRRRRWSQNQSTSGRAGSEGPATTGD